ncbi:hypothetical protein C1752_01427 [Acaryochloris thomasi RCC1774]|uniref:Methyltransferase type 11 domain-containing protein n=1 Tax=Acaryochloris thomasi RCC1774 TaxID=1764569 RepID=A0A2W1K2L6_9CYAN|nr:hypothetical protein [Acaryochloris thomasi]PZD74287.1 hypothetical protein C1752_01427 [Acaryochloris thomasi RCC1774]
MSEQLGIDYFGRKHPLADLHNQTTLKYRRKIYHFLVEAIGGVEGKVILDHGSTPDTEREASNCFIRWLVQDQAQVRATSPEPIAHLAQAFPGVKVMDWPLQLASNETLDCVLSSAVIEHVGSQTDQVEYVRSLLQLGSPLLMTTPNRYHWLEFHTKLPLIHWLPRAWHRGLLKLIGKTFWASESNLRLLSQQDFATVIDQALQHQALEVAITWYQPKFLGMVSNLCIFIQPTSQRESKVKAGE